jgi:hypothetical protein
MVRQNDFHYTVKGSWPFPTDMLRRDCSRAATPEDQAIVDRLSKDYAEDRDAIRNAVTINLVMPNTEHWRPNTARWASFGWEVPTDTEFQQIQAERKNRARMETLYKQAMAKLTPEERAAVAWFNPPPQH